MGWYLSSPQVCPHVDGKRVADRVSRVCLGGKEIAFKLRFNDRQVLLSASTKNLMAKWMLVRLPPPSNACCVAG
jgi:hypothetical protein